MNGRKIIGNAFSLQMLSEDVHNIRAEPIDIDSVIERVTKPACTPEWEYNKYGHVLVRHCDCSETYLQVDTDVTTFFENIGVNPDTIGDGDHDELKDDPYFEGDCTKEFVDDVIWAIGHKETAAIVGEQLTGKARDANRINVDIEPDDELYVAQVTGGRLPEGTTKLPAGAQLKWWKVTLSD